MSDLENDPLFGAIYSDDPMRALQQLTDSGVSALASPWQLFDIAVSTGRLDVVRFLISHGLTLQMDHERTPFLGSSYGTHRDTSLHSAASKGFAGILQALFEIDGKEYLETFDVDLAYTPLHYAAHDGQVEAAQVLLKAGANPNAHDESRIGKTPLEAAVESSSLPIVKLLLDAGADPDIPTWMWLSARDRAERQKEQNPEIWQAIQAVPPNPHKLPNGEWRPPRPEN